MSRGDSKAYKQRINPFLNDVINVKLTYMIEPSDKLSGRQKTKMVTTFEV